MSERSLFLAALDIEDPIARRVYLDEACAGDVVARQQVESLLRSYEQAGQFLDSPVVEPLMLSGSSDQGISLDFLRPSTQEGSLGRLAHYEVLEVLGRGGFGVVLRAFDEKLHRMVAIKVLGPQLTASDDARQRFLREARAAAAVRNENVVGIYAVDEQPVPHLVMEYVEGRTLDEKLAQSGALEVTEVLRIGAQIAEGLAAAHRQGLVHRDIKPANILLENCVERVKITDFGLARAANDASLTQSGLLAGTPMYMSPEQADGVAIDPRSDLFSLGSVLYLLCTGRPPFHGSTVLSVLRRVSDELPRPIREINAGVPAWLCDIIAKLHAKRPENRYASAREVADLLMGHLVEVQASGVASPPLATWKRIAAISTSATVIVVLAAVIPWLPDRATDGRTALPERRPPPLAIAPFDAAQAQRHQKAWANHLKVPLERSNSLGMKLRLLPPGEFLMGASPEEVAAQDHEKPQHKVRLTRAFAVGVHEVTVAQFQAFVDATGYQTTAETNGLGARLRQGRTESVDPALNWRTVAQIGPDQPARCLTHNDAVAFCEWLSGKENRTYRLLTEAQWEYACRAGTLSRFSTGDELGPDDAVVRRVLSPVGSCKPNSFGLHDMHGSVYEWTNDGQRVYAGDAVDPVQPADEGHQMLRGGAASSSANNCRSSSRQLSRDTIPYFLHGFRVALEIE